MYPYTCYTVPNGASLKGYGLADSNDADTYIKYYTDQDCKEGENFVKFSDLCASSNYQSVMFIAPVAAQKHVEEKVKPRNESMNDLRQLPLQVLTVDQRAFMDDELDAMLLAIEQETDDLAWTSESVKNATSEKATGDQKPSWSRLGMSILPRKKGDRYVSKEDRTISANVIEDDNSPGDSNGFSFTQQTRATWTDIWFRRFRQERNDHGSYESYQSGVTVGNHDIDVDIQLFNGNLQSTSISTFRKWLTLFARQGDGNSHRQWNLFQNNQIQASITFKAYRYACERVVG